MAYQDASQVKRIVAGSTEFAYNVLGLSNQTEPGQVLEHPKRRLHAREHREVDDGNGRNAHPDHGGTGLLHIGDGGLF